jgi:hypothetical protein
MKRRNSLGGLIWKMASSMTSPGQQTRVHPPDRVQPKEQQVAGFSHATPHAWNATLLSNLIQNLLLVWKFPRWRRALLAAVLSDALGFGVALFPPGQWLLDAVTAIVLFAVLGFRWPLFVALAVEAVPGLQLFPAWTLVVLALAATETESSLADKQAPARRPSNAKHDDA